ncbi:hypothetical protein N9R95_00600 [Flavobacteriaceae bacterium]|jgi:hypothetical protein|nr:hypothetical protein [Flavobacteriaceae bacterium]
MKNKILPLLLSVLLILLSSCELFDSTTVSKKEIKKASTWSSKDQAPSFPECESLNKKDQMECFQDLISEYLMVSIAESNLVASSPVQASVVLRLKVDKKGVFSLEEAEISNDILEVLPDLETVLEDAVANLPKALPATKTNVGVYVDAQFSLPINISAQPAE